MTGSEPGLMALAGIGLIVAGFIARLNPLLVVTVAAIVTGLLTNHGPVEVISAFGKAFNTNRFVSATWLVLPVIGLLERGGLQEQARRLISGIRAATAGRLLMVYFLFRQSTAAMGLTSVAGHAQTVRPLVAPMAEGASEAHDGPLGDKARGLIRAYAAATDNIAIFFGEDIFLAVSSILLIRGFLEQSGVHVEPLQLSVWAIPTAVSALVIHMVRLALLDGKLRRLAKAPGEGDAS